MDERGLDEVANALRVSRGDLVILLGAGASVSSGGPTSAQIATSLLENVGLYEDGYARDPGALLEAFNEYLQQLRDDTRFRFLKEYFDSLYPHVGYLFLAKIVEHAFREGRIDLIVTTNYDYMLEVSLAKFTDLFPGRDYSVFVLGSDDDLLAGSLEDRERLKILKVYGDFYQHIMLFTPTEVRSFSDAAQDAIDRMAGKQLLVIGYSGRDGLFQRLSLRAHPAPVWWVNPRSLIDRESPAYDRHVADFLRQRNGNLAKSRMISGELGQFDVFCRRLFEKVFGKERYDEICDSLVRDLLESRSRREVTAADHHALTDIIVHLSNCPDNRADLSTVMERLGWNRDGLLDLIRRSIYVEPRYEITVKDNIVSLSSRSTNYVEKLSLNRAAKKEIGNRCAEMVQEGETVLIDGGTTTLEVFEMLKQRVQRGSLRELHVVTNSVEISRAVSDVSGLHVWFLGGKMRGTSKAVVGDFASASLRAILDQIGVDAAACCFIGTTGIDPERGFCVVTSMEVAVKRAMMESSREKYVVADASKINFPLPNCFWPLEKDVTLVTNYLDFAPAQLAAYGGKLKDIILASSLD